MLFSFGLCLVPRKSEGKYERKKIEKKNGRKIKNRSKVNKLFLHVFLNSFYLFSFIV